MKINKWLLYFLYGLLLLAYIIFGEKMMEYLNELRFSTFEGLSYMIGSTIIFVLGGILLGLEMFIVEAKKKGRWKINWPKALFLGIPSLYLALCMFVMFLPNFHILEILWYPILMFYSLTDLIPIFQVAFGYILITSFFKKEID